jgi:hypothetical protein
VISSGLLVTLALGALSASLALLMARLQWPIAAHLFAGGGAACGIAAFVAVAVSTLRRARQLPSQMPRP